MTKRIMPDGGLVHIGRRPNRNGRPHYHDANAKGAIAEFGYCTVSPMWNYAPLTRVVEAIKELGPERCILMSEGGQRHNPVPAECLRVFAQSVYEPGVSEVGVNTMIKDDPLDLLELPTPSDVAPNGAGRDGAVVDGLRGEGVRETL